MSRAGQREPVPGLEHRRGGIRAHVSTRGVLLFEVTVAIVVITLALVWMLRSFSHSIVVVEVARDQGRRLSVLSAQALERITLGRVSQLTDTGHVEAPPSDWSIDVLPLTFPDDDALLMQMHVDVTWTTRGRERRVTGVTWLPPEE